MLPPAGPAPHAGRGGRGGDAYGGGDAVLPQAASVVVGTDAAATAAALAAAVSTAKEAFEIGQVLGRGGYGTVYLARDARTSGQSPPPPGSRRRTLSLTPPPTRPSA